MARVEKVLLRKGVYRAPQGVFRATPERLRHFTKQFDRMTRAGIRVPVAWGHQPAAEPGDADERAARQYWLSRYNAGYLTGLKVGPDGQLRFQADIPGCEVEGDKLVSWVKQPDGSQVKAAIGEVSAAIKDWTCGKGGDYKDAIIHVALTPLPVVAGMGGFDRAKADPKGVTHLSLSDFLQELGANMADEKDELQAETNAAGTETTTPPPPEPIAPAPAAPADDGKFGHVVALLRRKGIPLPPNTTPDNLLHNLEVACYALSEQEADSQGKDGKEDVTATDEEEEQASGGEEQPVYQQEQRPMMMSLSTAQNARERLLMEREQARYQASQLAVIDRAVKAGLCDGSEATRLRSAVSAVELSIAEDGTPQRTDVDIELSVYSRQLKHSQSAAVRSVQKGQKAVRPGYEDRTKQQEEAGAELAELAGAPVK